jgi:hypothetical protein
MRFREVRFRVPRSTLIALGKERGPGSSIQALIALGKERGPGSSIQALHDTLRPVSSPIS